MIFVLHLRPKQRQELKMLYFLGVLPPDRKVRLRFVRVPVWQQSTLTRTSGNRDVGDPHSKMCQCASCSTLERIDHSHERNGTEMLPICG